MAKVFLKPEIMSGLGEDTFWTWIQRELGCEIGVPKKIDPQDIVLHYSTVGRPEHPNQTVTLLWELYPEMRLRLGSRHLLKMRKIAASQSARWAVCPTHYSRAFYGRTTEVIPIGVDTNLFRPADDKSSLRSRLGLPVDKKIAIWSGAHHVMKGPDLRDAWAKENPDWHLVTIRKEAPIPQDEVADYLAASDAMLNTSRLVPLFMTEWEALAVDLPLIAAGGIERELSCDKSGREYVFGLGWDRATCLDTWRGFIEKCRYELRASR